MIDPALLRRVGEALYGQQWQAPLARDLPVSERHMRRLLAGTTPISPGIAGDLARLCRDRLAELADVAATLDTASADPAP